LAEGELVRCGWVGSGTKAGRDIRAALDAPSFAMLAVSDFGFQFCSWEVVKLVGILVGLADWFISLH
jgi:hypothetical protein